MLKTIFMGTPEFAIPSLEIVDKNTDLKLIFTKEDKPNSRGNKIMNSPVKNYALENNISILQPSKMRDEEIISEIICSSFILLGCKILMLFSNA